MKPITIQQVKQAVSGIWMTAIPEHALAHQIGLYRYSGVSNRAACSSHLKGDNFDAHDFLVSAAQWRKAIGRDREQYTCSADSQSAADPRERCPQGEMGKLAQFVRKQMRSKAASRWRDPNGKDDDQTSDRCRPAAQIARHNLAQEF